MTILAVTPLMLFASGMALLRANDASQLGTAAAWITVAAVPILISISTVVIVGIASEAMVMEWLFYLERLSRAYARGRYSLRPKRLQQAPLEFRQLGKAVENMAAAVEHRDQALRDALEEQTILLREVHHRVKNNLQIIGSLLGLQAARSKDPAVKAALQDALVRIDAMSLGQRFMKQREEEDRVSAVDLFEAFADQIRSRLGSGKRVFMLTIEIEAKIIPLETGSRLAAIAAEAMICAFRGTQANPLLCTLSVRFGGGRVELMLAAPTEPTAFSAKPESMSRDLIDGYVRQVKGVLMAPDGGGTLSVSAPCRLLDASVADAASEAEATKFFHLSDRTHGRLAS
jgi:hypothetical protein